MSMEKKSYRVGIVGATGTVGQKFLTLLEDHPWFRVTALAASGRSAGKPFAEAVAGRWAQPTPIPKEVAGLIVWDAENEIEKMATAVDFVFCAVSLDKSQTRALEERYAEAGLPVVSNNSAHRWTEDVPMILPEVNPHHLGLIPVQRKRRGWKRGLIVVKPNCSIQSYVPVLEAWKAFGPEEVIVSTYQAISGAGKTFETWPEMVDNVIPYIAGEEEKSEQEPLRVWGTLREDRIVLAEKPRISATCIRVPVTDGHMASVHVRLREKVDRETLIQAIRSFQNPLDGLGLPSAPHPFLHYFEEPDRPQTRLDRDFERGMGITVGRLREDRLFDWRFVALSHNTIRGAAGGSILTAELLARKGYLDA